MNPKLEPEFKIKNEMKLRVQIIIAAVFLLFTGFAKAQDDEFQDLRVLYMDQKYDKLISKAEGYVNKDKTRKNPEPYLYLSKAYFEISKLEEYNKKYPPEKAFREAMKWATKYRRKDREGEIYDDNDFYFNELKKAVIEEAAGLMSDDKFSRAKRYYSSITSFDPDDPGAWLMLGYSQIKMRAMMEAKIALEEAGRVMHRVDMTKLNSVERKLLLDGVLGYSDYLMEQGMRDSARTTLDLAKPALEGDPEFDMFFNRVN